MQWAGIIVPAAFGKAKNTILIGDDVGGEEFDYSTNFNAVKKRHC